MPRTTTRRNRQQKHEQPSRRTPPLGYNSALDQRLTNIRIMEADQLNAIQNHLADLASRAAELRRYL